MQTPGSRDVLRFGDFELDLAAYELRRRGRQVKLGRQPMDLLILLVERRGHLVSRSDIVERLWGKDVFVDVETGVNTAVSKVRQALRDSAGAPALLETVAGKGYRFIATVELVSAGPPPAVGATPSSADSPVVPVDATAASRPRRAIRPRIWIGALLALMTAGIVSFSGITDIVRTRAVTLAVLPFENLGSDPEREYLAAGLTDETSASLAQIDPAHLIVKGRTLRYKGTTKTAGEIGQELGVDYLVESSIRAEGALVRVTVTLIRARDQQHLWSQSYDREPTSLLSLQQELSAAIAAQVKLRLSPDRLNDLGRRQTLNADAYDLYLRGRDQAHRRTADGNARAIELYRRAIAIDGNYALAWADLAFTYGAATINGDAPPGAVGPQAREAAMQSVRANPELPEAQLSLGYELWLVEWDWNAAEAALRRAVELDPSSATAHRILGHALSQFGRRDESEASMQRARELDPVDALNRALSSQVAFQNRDLPSAVDHARRAIALDPGLWIGYIELAQAYEGSGEHDLALEAIADAERLAGGNSKVASLKGYVLARMGRTVAAREVLKTLEETARVHYLPPYAPALVHAGLGDRDEMFAALDRAHAVRDVHLMYLPVAMHWDPYRADPRFIDLLARCAFSR